MQVKSILRRSEMERSPLPPDSPDMLRREWLEVVGKEGTVGWLVFYEKMKRYVVSHNSQATWEGMVAEVQRRLSAAAPGDGDATTAAPLQLASELCRLDAEGLFMVLAANAVLQAPLYPSYGFDLPLGPGEVRWRTVEATDNFSIFILWWVRSRLRHGVATGHQSAR